jgi:hypothetical protein
MQTSDLTWVAMDALDEKYQGQNSPSELPPVMALCFNLYLCAGFPFCRFMSGSLNGNE